MKALLIALLLLSLAARAETTAPQRIVSLNLCTDQILLQLVPRQRIVMLSSLAADPLLSWQARAAAGIPRFGGSVEAVLKLDPDLVLSGSLASVGSAGVLRRLGYRVETLEMPESVHGSLDFIEQIALLVGEHDAGIALRRRTEQRLQSVHDSSQQSDMPVALIYLPSGLSPGAGTLKHELLGIAGWRNFAAQNGIEGYGSITLERIVLQPPDIMLFDSVDLAHASLSQHLLRHPVMSQRIASRNIPTPLWICGGPQIAEAAELLSRRAP
jgi:iron complex transport system substrate-binding protein